MIITDLPSSTKLSQLRSSLVSSLTLKPLLLYISILNFLWFAMAKKSWSSLSSVSGGGLRRYLNQQYYLKRPQRSALLIVAFVFLTWWLVCDRPTLAGEQQADVSRLNEELPSLRNQLEDLRSDQTGSGVSIRIINKTTKINEKNIAQDDPLNIQRRQKVRESMLHAWASYEKYAWGQDELQPQTKNGTDSFGGLGATLVDSLDTLFIMGLDEQFQRAREWVANSLDFNKDYEASVFETTIRLHWKSFRWTS